MCGYICEMTDGYENPVFEDVMLCMIDNKCLPDYPRSGQHRIILAYNRNVLQLLGKKFGSRCDQVPK